MRSAIMPSKSRPICLLMYRYCLIGTPAFLKMALWLPQVGVGR